MKIIFLQDYEEHKKGDIVEISSRDEGVWERINKGIIKRYTPKQQKPTNDKMMRVYQNK